MINAPWLTVKGRLDKMTDIKILYSSSDGNSTLISDGGTNILIDAGGNEKRLKEALEGVNQKIETLSAIFITHEHTDHTKSLYTLSKHLNVPIYTSIDTARGICSKKDVSTDTLRCVAGHIRTVEAGNTYEVGSILVTPFKTPHDVDSHGFKIEFSSGKTFAYATDTGCVTREMLKYFEGADLAVIESNHERDMVINGTYPEFLKQRILSDAGHLSNEVASRFALWLAQNGTREIILAHLSDDNNTPEIAKSVTRSRLDENNFNNVSLLIADKYFPTGTHL